MERDSTLTESANGLLSTDGVVIGLVVGFDEDKSPRVSFPMCGKESGVKARSTIVLSGSDIGKQVALMFESQDGRRPLIIGKIVSPSPSPIGVPQELRTAEIDSDRLVLEADREVVIKCGKSSITLTRAGKVIVRGTYILQRSSGVNKIKGASVQIN